MRHSLSGMMMSARVWSLASSAVATLLVALGASSAAAAEDAARHPQSGAGGVVAPPGVPATYVLTHNGWFHPSCVVRVQPDEVVGADRLIRDRGDGAARFAFAPCAYARFDLGGRSLSRGTAAPVHAGPQPAAVPAPAIYDGYIVYYAYDGSIAVGSTLVTDEIVPPAPANVANQDIAFFNDILTTAGDGGDILQPVLDFNGETRGKWSIESEHCCISGNDMQTTPVVVAPGDQIRGTVTGTGCATSGVCSAWAVTTADVTSGKSTTLNTTAPGGVPNGVSPGSLETYGVMSCDMFPVGGETTFTGNTLTDPEGNVQTLKYRLINFQGVDPEVPTNCGYGGRSSGNDFTLIYGTVPSSADAGTSTGGAAGAGGHGGVAGAGGHGGVGGKGATGGGGGAGGKVAGPGGAAGQGAVAGAGGAAGRVETGGAPGAGGAAGSKGGSGGQGVGATGTGGQLGVDGGAGAAGTGGDETQASGGGCSCDLGGAPSGQVGAALLVLALTALRRRRRVR